MHPPVAAGGGGGMNDGSERQRHLKLTSKMTFSSKFEGFKVTFRSLEKAELFPKTKKRERAYPAIRFDFAGCSLIVFLAYMLYIVYRQVFRVRQLLHFEPSLGSSSSRPDVISSFIVDIQFLHGRIVLWNFEAPGCEIHLTQDDLFKPIRRVKSDFQVSKKGRVVSEGVDGLIFEINFRKERAFQPCESTLQGAR